MNKQTTTIVYKITRTDQTSLYTNSCRDNKRFTKHYAIGKTTRKRKGWKFGLFAFGMDIDKELCGEFLLVPRENRRVFLCRATGVKLAPDTVYSLSSPFNYKRPAYGCEHALECDSITPIAELIYPSYETNHTIA
jgi:hypothetical protein